MQSYIGSISSSVTAEELIKVYAHLTQLGAEAETITVSGMKNLSTGFGIAGVISGALWPDDTIMPGFQEQDIVLDHVMGGYVHNSELRKLVITSIKENDSSLLEQFHFNLN
ncbi:hypothetical protein [Acetobacter thailandicus]|uniref:hypothetical protein n=1 Tax=Acetobacter thailandicus TaxID=1502842 RepID=UPI001BA65A11|nr:hypothetical protein [Acetobacter thailandicus]MBS0961458.1 hypothetical protein [Acetobacter thailandicus]